MAYAPKNVGSKSTPLMRRQDRARFDMTRGTSFERGYDTAWKQVRLEQLKNYPLCADHLTQFLFIQASEVHHIVKVADNPGMRDDPNNMLSLCKSCHSIRTAKGE